MVPPPSAFFVGSRQIDVHLADEDHFHLRPPTDRRQTEHSRTKQSPPTPPLSDMDGITEPVVLVIGHPIAGNPAQFAMERALSAMQLPWRVLSCDVPAEKVNEALAGAQVLGFRGLLLDRGLLEPNHQDNSDSSHDDFYFFCRESKSWHSKDLLGDWLQQSVKEHFATKEDTGALLSIGTPHPSAPYELSDDQTQTPIAWAAPETIEQSDWIVLTEPVETDQWPPSEKQTLVIDLSNPSNNVTDLRCQGYVVLGREEARIGVLIQCLRHLTSEEPPVEVLQEAIEEYLAV